MPDRLQLTKNAQFFVPKTEVTDESVLEILNEASQNINANDQFLLEDFRKDRFDNASGITYKCSIRVFPTERPVYFFDAKISDIIYAFILIIEVDGYIALFKKSCANTSDATDAHFNQINNTLLTSTFDDDKVSFQKISIRNMTVSDRALRARSYEAVDLKGLFSTHAAGRSIPYFFKIRQGSSVKSISAHSGRIVELSERKGIHEIALWAKNQINLIKNPAANKSFLNSFAKLIELDQVLQQGASPAAILIESAYINDYLSETGLPLTYKDKDGQIVQLNDKQQNLLIQKLERVYEINNKWQIIGREKKSQLKLNAKSISIASQPLRNIKIMENGKQMSLQKFIVKNELFSVCFDNPKFMYFMGRCFEDTSGISEIQSILDILHPQVPLNNVQSEKGSLHTNSTHFEVDSMFAHVEGLHSSDDYIFCDDLGNEWADHITFNESESCISFIHSKHGKTSKSASNMHDLVGQGIKNLGNMYFTKADFLKKVKGTFQSNYNNQTVQSQISRIRKGNVGAIDNFLNDFLKDYHLYRRCILSCSFLSKNEISTEFNKLKLGKPVAGHIIQLFWIISSFAHAAKEMNVMPLIYCKP